VAEPGEDTCLDCHHPDHGTGTCQVLCLIRRGPWGTGEQEEVPCGCEDSWTARQAAAAPPVTPDPWQREVLPQHTRRDCPELYAVTPGRDTCTCPRPRPDEPPF